MKITIKSIAEELGISFSTVSKALNDSPLIKDETKHLVLEKAKELNYKPNYFAKGLRNMHTKTIGIILNDLENPANMNMIRKISVDMAKYDYTTLICDSQFDTDLETKNIKTVISRMPDSVIISPINSDSNSISLLNQLFDRTIILDTINDNINTNYIFINHERAGYLSANFLIGKGHKTNLIMTGPKGFSGSNLFVKGIKQAYSEQGLELDEKYILYSKPSHNDAYKLLMESYHKLYEDESTRFTGLMAFCDTMAFGVYSAAKKLNLKIPDDLSVVGYDDSPVDTFAYPPLTTIHMPKERVASLCSDLLVSKLVNNDSKLIAVSLEPHLVERESVKNI
ncbi:MAG: LacI family transcriptional regulator [Clostridia bacterium]|nr:LacI family transcriptional regulator [Clostridia bacterium]